MIKQSDGLVYYKLWKKNGPSFPQVQVGTKGALLSYVVQVSCSALLPLLMLSSRSLAGDSSKGAVPVNLQWCLLQFDELPATVELKHSTF